MRKLLLAVAIALGLILVAVGCQKTEVTEEPAEGSPTHEMPEGS